MVFEKPIQNLSYERIGEELAKMGLQGIEATIRKKGHIEQKDAESEVPKMVSDLAKNGQKALIAATHVGEANEENAAFLRILKANGITRYRMSHFRYDLKKDMLTQLEENTAKLKDIAAMNREIGIQSLYQTHSGYGFAGSLSWDLAMMFQGLDPVHCAIAFDVRHVRTDSGLSYKVAHATIKKHVSALYVKDAIWSGKRGGKLKNVPLDTGFVTKKDFDLVRSTDPTMPISLHMEWGKSQIYPKESAAEPLKLIARDAQTLKSWL